MTFTYLQQNQGKCPAQNCSVEAPGWMPVHHCTVSLIISRLARLKEKCLYFGTIAEA